MSFLVGQWQSSYAAKEETEPKYAYMCSLHTLGLLSRCTSLVIWGLIRHTWSWQTAREDQSK